MTEYFPTVDPEEDVARAPISDEQRRLVERTREVFDSTHGEFVEISVDRWLRKAAGVDSTPDNAELTN